jgi:hypothetical protein
MFANYALSYNMRELGPMYLSHFTPWNYSYLQKETTRDDVEIQPIELLSSTVKTETSISKYYLA